MDPLDVYIGKRIKHYTARQNPPDDARTRLLKAAASTSVKRTNRLLQERQPIFWKRTYEGKQNSEWSPIPFDLSRIYTFGVLNLRQVM